MANENKFVVSLSPHISSNYTIPKIMTMVMIALVPAWIASIFYYGFRAFWLTALGMITAVATEFIIQKLRKVPITAFDGSAALAGMLLAFNVPPGVSWWIPVLGSFFAIAIAKQAFGGLGYNILNPALAGRAFLMASFPIEMTTKWIAPKDGTLAGFVAQGFDAVTGATPLTAFKLMRSDILGNISPEKVAFAKEAVEHLYHTTGSLFFGRVGGVIGETSALLLLIGGIFLIITGLIDWRVPLSFIGTVAFFGWVFGGVDGAFSGNALFHVLSGGLMLGAFFMATDMVTTPITKKGRLIFGFGCGFITIVIRCWGGYPEGVSYSILLMNIAAPLIDRFTKTNKFGAVK